MMKKRLVIALVVLAACAKESHDQRAAPMSPASTGSDANSQLTIVVDAEYALPTGWGVTWNATVREVIEGAGLADRAIRLGLFDNSNGTRYAGHFQGQRETAVRLRLRRLATRPGALEGFVASDGTIWHVEDVAQ